MLLVDRLTRSGSNLTIAGDGASFAAFRVTWLEGGWVPLMTAAATDPSASVTVSERIPGGLDMLPIDGSMLLAASSTPAVSVQLRGQTYATCGAVDWSPKGGLYTGCYQTSTEPGRGLLNLKTATSTRSLWYSNSPHHCAKACVGSSHFALYSSHCYCFDALDLAAFDDGDYRQCQLECEGDESLNCGGEAARSLRRPTSNCG